MESSGRQRIEVVRGRLDAALAERLVAFWTANGVLTEQVARERLEQVVCIRFDADDEIVGVNSVYADRVPLVGRRFWVYRRYLAPGADEEAEPEMIEAARAELAQGFAGGPEEPLGLCVLVADPAVIERYPDAVWPAGGLLFAGYTDEGVQVRISYFEGARI